MVISYLMIDNILYLQVGVVSKARVPWHDVTHIKLKDHHIGCF